MRKKELEKIVAAITDSPATIISEKSYNYSTKTSRRRGGYDRVRTTSYWWNGQKLIKPLVPHAAPDELTGQPLGIRDCEPDNWWLHYNWLLPIPEKFHGMMLKSKGLFSESVIITENLYAKFFGEESSAMTLSADASREESIFNELPPSIHYSRYTLGDYYIDFTLFWDKEWRSQFWTSTEVITFRDGVLESREQTHPPEKPDYMMLIPVGKQLSLF